MTLSRRQFAYTVFWGSLGTTLALLPTKRAHAEDSITVENTEELLNAIAPNRTLQLSRGAFMLSDIDAAWRSPYARFEEVYDGYELVISNVENLKLVGVDNTLSRIVTRPRYADVLKFENCRNIEFDNLELAHTGDAGFCRGSVFGFVDCEDVRIGRCVMIGSGTHGIEANGLKQLRCNDSIIRDCTYGILCLLEASDVEFEASQFFGNQGFSMINLSDCQRVRFSDCQMYDNRVDLIEGAPPIGNDYMFNVMNSGGIELSDCTLRDNLVSFLAPFPGAIQMLNTTILNNSFESDRLYPEEDRPQSSPFCPV